jgi:hypothetical protein
MRHFHLCELGYAVGFIVLLAALYIGAYYAMVQKDDVFPYPFKADVASYHFGDEWAESFFAPAHAIDRRLRPEFWEYEISSNEARPAKIGS